MVLAFATGLPYYPADAICLHTKTLELRLSFTSLGTPLHGVAFYNGGGRDHAKLYFVQVKPFSVFSDSKRADWSISSNSDNRGFDPLINGDGRTRLIRAVQNLLMRLNAKIQDLRKDLPRKLLFFLVGFYCATAFATVIGQTGDWDILSAALAVVVVEGIGALMYKASVPMLDKIRSTIVIFNYWKAGLTLGLFLDSFKY